MGKLNCSCFNNNEKGQFNFENNPENVTNNIIIKKKSLFEIISDYYNSKNIEVQKINQEEFFEMINSDSNIIKLLKEYEEIFDKYNISFDFNNTDVELIKFIDDNDTKESSIFFYYGEFNENGMINGTGIKVVKQNYIYKGEFTNGEYNGKGLLIKNGASIFGDWEYGQISGNVIYKIESKFEYTGNFENNKKMVLEPRNILMVLFIKEILLIIKKVVKVHFHFLMMNIMKEILKMIYIMEKVNMYGKKMGKNMLENLKMGKLKEKELIHMKMEHYLEVHFLMDIKMGKVVLNFLMEKNIMEIG